MVRGVELDGTMEGDATIRYDTSESRDEKMTANGVVCTGVIGQGGVVLEIIGRQSPSW